MPAAPARAEPSCSPAPHPEPRQGQCHEDRNPRRRNRRPGHRPPRRGPRPPGRTEQQPRPRLPGRPRRRTRPLAHAGTPAEAAAAELVLLAVGWPQIPDATAGLPPFDGRIVIDATNQFVSLPPHPNIADLGELTGSEYVASLLPGARVVKAFNTLYGQYIAADPRHQAGRQVLFLAGDDADAKTTVKDLTAAFGFAPVDLGSLREGGRLMQLGGPLSALHALKQD